jgi:Holliday junction resolvase-like predicted endonuclease
MPSSHPAQAASPCSTTAGFLGHLRADGLAVAMAFLWRALASRMLPAPRDAGERAAERFLRALGYRVLARNWRSPRDARDEADLVVLSPDRREVVIVEVKRAAGPWDALGRVDSRKKSVLWRLVTDLESVELHGASVPSALRHAVGRAEFVRVDLVGVRGVGRTASVVDHDCGLFLRTIRGRRAGRPP